MLTGQTNLQDSMSSLRWLVSVFAKSLLKSYHEQLKKSFLKTNMCYVLEASDKMVEEFRIFDLNHSVVLSVCLSFLMAGHELKKVHFLQQVWSLKQLNLLMSLQELKASLILTESHQRI